MSYRSSTPGALRPTVSRKTASKIGGHSRRKAPSGGGRKHMAMFPSFHGIGAGLNEHLNAGRAGAQPVLVAQASRVRSSGPAQSISLVSHPRCTYPIPCGKCHYCLRAEFGPEYWLNFPGPIIDDSRPLYSPSRKR
jgi:hypothetical protein